MLDLEGLRRLVKGLGFSPLFATVSGAHLYGFPSPDSDIDVRGSHRLALREIVGLRVPKETVEAKLDLKGIEVELVSHEIGKYLRLLVKNNGYILEQIFSPIIVLGQSFLDQLRPLARGCITRHHYHHYRGFLGTQRQLLAKEEPKGLKTLLYAYRVVLTGIHLLRTGEVEAHLPRLAEEYHLPFIAELIQAKVTEKAQAANLDWPFHDARLLELESRLDEAFQKSTLPEDCDQEAVNEFLIGLRLGETGRNEKIPHPR